MLRSSLVRFGQIRAKTPRVGDGQRIGVLGGSFNPPHVAHLLISEIARRRLGLDAIWWLVTPGNPLKDHGNLAPLAERMDACRALVGHRPIKISDVEAGLASPYTAATLAFLKVRHPSVQFVWIMGADCLASFDRWQHWRQIFDTIPIAVVDRPGWRLKALSSPAACAYATRRVPETQSARFTGSSLPAWTFLTGPLSTVSSTSLRVAKKTQISTTKAPSQRPNRPDTP
jgi:nicotinate-nucleotide adenylyltransferase